MTDLATMDRIKSEIEANPVLLFMKGTPVFPQCGFSAA
ncbi:MAG: monothiol glutaredoxin, Grx4 family, partial [Alphaproteobacteria bacterium]|nr:monothiol glutaredoxin, Grx4 family [Alphaproteobacteria bacterium]